MLVNLFRLQGVLRGGMQGMYVPLSGIRFWYGNVVDTGGVCPPIKLLITV